MKLLVCDCCHSEVNDYGHWYNDAKPRNMYELKCIHDVNSNTYDGMVLCHECIGRLIHGAESESSSSEKSNKWIPVSERLPEKNVEVLVTTEWGCITIGEMFSNNDWFIHEGATSTNIDDIKAWMPLPEPFKESEG